MNFDIMLNVLMSALFFLPLLIGLVFFITIGVLMTLEGIVSLYKVETPKVEPKDYGPIATEMMSSLNDQPKEIKKSHK